MVHRTAADGFVRPEVYEKGRPDYPEAALEAMGAGPKTEVLDLGCGTGKLTTRLAARGASVVGAEPLPAMLGKFRELHPDIVVVAAVAESLPFRPASFDVIACASAFHWFDHERALPEIHRCLRPGGRLAIVWNRRDRVGGWAARFWEITERHRRGTPGYRNGEWREAVEGSGLFGPIAEHTFDHVQRADAEGLIARVASISFVETSPEREAIIDEARRFLDATGSTEFELPYTTAVYTAERHA